MIDRLNYIFIDEIPDDLEEGILYISPRFRVIMHSCCCGCKNKVVTPLSPVRWEMTFDGKYISLYPSIGNWNFDCKSHYWIKNSKVIWANKWDDIEIIEGKLDEREKRKEYYEKVNQVKKNKLTNKVESKVLAKTEQKSLLAIIKNFFRNTK